jgi:tRNA modification GTPase
MCQLRRFVGFNQFKSLHSNSLNQLKSVSDTIYALSSGTNSKTKTGIAVIRISGPQALECLNILCDVGLKSDNKKQSKSIPKERMASLRYLYCPKTKDLLDQSIVLCFNKPKSFTGEDVVEIHAHGSRAVISGIFQALEYISDNNNNIFFEDNEQKNSVIRAADRGEFTRRAFENGRMDLTEVEGLADLLDADTSEQRKQALKQMGGHLKNTFERWRFYFYYYFYFCCFIYYT